MHSAVKNSRKEGRLNISSVGPSSGSTKPAVPTTLRALTLVVFSALLLLAARPASAQTETVVYNFTGARDGGSPLSGLTPDTAGNLYGTTNQGGVGSGQGGEGTVFELSPKEGGGWSETVLYSFCSVLNCTDGAHPFYTPLIFDGAGNLYGTTKLGGTSNKGVVFELSPVGKSWTETALHSFAGGTDDGADPINGLIMDAAGKLYGATNAGGTSGWGTVYELSPSGGGWTEQVIYNIPTQIDFMYAGLTMDAAGNIFGATYRPGTVFELSPSGSGGWNSTVLYTFKGAPKDGDRPKGTPVLDKAGNLYGTTEIGGAKNIGTVYRLSPEKDGKWKEKILHPFKGGSKDGSGPFAGVVLDADGNIYGNTYNGGTSSGGIIYELVAPVGRGSYKEKVLWSFNNAEGFFPYGALILDSAGNLYGTTDLGGSGGAGVVFEFTP